MLALDGVSEVIVVNDGSSDDTLAVCTQFADERLRLVTHERNRGVAAARNTGVAHARGSWILFGEDDCRFPRDYATVLRAVADREAADIVGAPIVRVRGDDRDAAELAARVPRRSRPPTMDEDSVFPAQAMQTPFLPARALVRRTVFDGVAFDEGYCGNAYREETDFFVQAARSGFRCVLTSETYCYQLESWSGGQHRYTTARYEYWTLVNNWRFLRRHGSWLAEQGYISGELNAQARFLLRRARTVTGGVLGKRLLRLRGTSEHATA